ncbi:helix-turn-helix transcriptional regulator [Deminuibacter soli]|nr:helix-turn-helix transcriptional regulator [Deminuibacter soli]
MIRVQTLQDFYYEHFNGIAAPAAEVEHFSVFKRNAEGGPVAIDVDYSRKGFYKICLLKGKCRIRYADQVYDVEGNTLFFVNPLVPYGLEVLDDEQGGYFCVFSDVFISGSCHLRTYPLFKPGEYPVFSLTNEQAAEASAIFERMLTEVGSTFTYKYDALRNMAQQLMLFALKLCFAASRDNNNEASAGARLMVSFNELLEGQFPVRSVTHPIKYRYPLDVANALGVSVNHLNFLAKQITGNTTSQLIAGRFVQEAKILLAHTQWSVSDIGRSLGFEEMSHFARFFKKYAGLSPRDFRNLGAGQHNLSPLNGVAQQGEPAQPQREKAML